MPQETTFSISESLVDAEKHFVIFLLGNNAWLWELNTTCPCVRQGEKQAAPKQKTGQVTLCDSVAEHSLPETHLRRENLQLLIREENRSARCWNRMGHLLRVAPIDQCSPSPGTSWHQVLLIISETATMLRPVLTFICCWNSEFKNW